MSTQTSNTSHNTNTNTVQTSTFNIEDYIPSNFSAASKTWVFQSNKLLSVQQAFDLEHDINTFLPTWKTHGQPVEGYANLFFGRFLILMANENTATVGGCSTDSMMRFVKDEGQKFQVDFFDRTLCAFYKNNKVEMVPQVQIAPAIKNGVLTPETIYFNNAEVTTKQTLIDKWMVALANSWLKKYLPS